MSPRFTVVQSDQNTGARVGRLQTRRGIVETPVFMPVGTQAAVKTLAPAEVRCTGAQIILANTYHLMLRPGPDVIQAAGGIHDFMGWDGPVLTDSGGFQVFSLSNMRSVSERGVSFRSHIDGSPHELTPERSIDLQLAIGSDIIMPLDELAGYEDPKEHQREAAERTHRWLLRSIAHFASSTSSDANPPMMFGICQGGFEASDRARSASVIASSRASGFAIGGLSVGESKRELGEMLTASISELPSDGPRYLMGVGSPEDIWNAVELGVDMFDCVHPTRVARRGAVFTRDGRVNLNAARYREVFNAIERDCDCIACTEFTLAYLHHLFRVGEQLGQRLATIHNLRFYARIMEEMRSAVISGHFVERKRAFLSRYRTVDERVSIEQRQRWRGRGSDAKQMVGAPCDER